MGPFCVCSFGFGAWFSGFWKLGASTKAREKEKGMADCVQRIVRFLQLNGPTLGRDIVFAIGVSWEDLERAERAGFIEKQDPPWGGRGWLYTAR